MVSLPREGMTNKAIASNLGADANKVNCRRCRVVKERMSSIEKECPCGTSRSTKDSNKRIDVRSKVLEATAQHRGPFVVPGR